MGTEVTKQLITDKLQSEEKKEEPFASSILQMSEEKLITLTETYPQFAIKLFQKELIKKAASVK